MRSCLGIMAVFALAAFGAFALALAHNAYAPSSTDDAVVSASSRGTYTGYALGGARGYLGDLPLGEPVFDYKVVGGNTGHRSCLDDCARWHGIQCK
jgi:hypothetical protein